MSKPVAMAVVGVGHFGNYHAQKVAKSARAELVAVADVDGKRAEEVARPLGIRAVADHKDLIGLVDAVCIAVPTLAHAPIAADFLENGVDVLVEKPIANDVESARRLVELARGNGRILQVGHLERFSGMAEALRKQLDRPLFVDSVRIAPFKPRGTDVNVILDLMIHDLDLILSLIESRIVSVDAAGAPVFSGNEDIASARIKFANGCIADITASRISLKTERRMRIFQPDTYITVDFETRSIRTIRKPKQARISVMPKIDIEDQNYRDGDPLEREIESFVTAVVERSEPPVSGEDGVQALEAAIAVTDSLRAHADFVREVAGDKTLARTAT
jgi:predicted dehydrogenase